MEIIEKLIILILISFGASVGQVWSGRVLLNGPSIQTSDLRAIDGYVASGLPLFGDTHGFVLHSGMRPVIVKVKDPNKVIRDGIEQPNPSYYRDLPSVIPHGLEGFASTSFLLGHPIPPSHLYAPLAGPVASFQHPLYRAPIALQMRMLMDKRQDVGTNQKLESPSTLLTASVESTSEIEAQNPQHVAESSIRVESMLSPRIGRTQNNEFMRENEQKHPTNPVVVRTSEFESKLPLDFQNPFYSNEVLANRLALESLPVSGEEVVDQWNTNKIREGRVRDLLTGAGLI